MATSSGNESARDLRRRQIQRLRRWPKVQSLLVRWIAAGLGGGMIAGLVLTIGMFIASNTASVVNAQASQQISPNVLSSKAYAFKAPQSAGDDAQVVLFGTANGVLLTIGKTSDAPAHVDAGILIDATCEFSAKSLVGTVIDFDESQKFIIDDQSGAILLVGSPQHGGHTNYFWQLESSGEPEIITLPNQAGVEITDSVLVTRYTRGATPVGSFQLALALTIMSDGTLSCGVVDP